MEQIKIMDTFKSISKPASGIYKELGSKFLSFAYPVSSEEEIKDILACLRKTYFDAKHHCYAYRLGRNGEKWKVSDDGEPSSTGGKPILGQLLSNELSDILIVVVRYFGGTKLGLPGLMRAYRNAAADAVSNSEIIMKTVFKQLVVHYDYSLTHEIMQSIKENEAEIVDQRIEQNSILKLKIKENAFDSFCNKLSSFGATFEICN